MAASRLILCPVFITVSQNFPWKFCFSRIYNHFWKILLIFVSARLVDCLLATAHIIPLGTTHNYLFFSVLHILKFLLIILCKSFFCGELWFLPQLKFWIFKFFLQDVWELSDLLEEFVFGNLCAFNENYYCKEIFCLWKLLKWIFSFLIMISSIMKFCFVR